MLDFLNISFYGISIFIILLMLFICLYLFLKVKLLKKQIEDLNINKIDNKTLSKEEDIIPIRDISKEEINEDKDNKEDIVKKEIPKANNKKENIKHKIELYQPNYKNNNLRKQAYTKNVLNERPNITSPVSLNNEEFNINDLAPKKNTTNNYLDEVSKKIAKEIKPHTIELTDYEKEQEDNAIISYQELLNAKDKINNYDDEIETVDFIEELKKFRNSLE